MRQKITNLIISTRGFASSSLNPPRPTAILFDWDGTIVEFAEQRFVNSFNKTLHQLCYPERLWLKDLSQSKSILDSFEKRTQSPQEALAAYNLFKDVFSADLISEKELMPGAKQLISLINSHKIPTGVISNLDDKLLITQIRTLGLTSSFNIIIGSAQKPDHYALTTAAQILHLKQNKAIWFIGDTKSDVIAAEAAGFTSVLIQKSQTVAVQTDIKLTNLHDVTQILTALQQGRSR